MSESVACCGALFGAETRPAANEPASSAAKTSSSNVSRRTMVVIPRQTAAVKPSASSIPSSSAKIAVSATPSITIAIDARTAARSSLLPASGGYDDARRALLLVQLEAARKTRAERRVAPGEVADSANLDVATHRLDHRDDRIDEAFLRLGGHHPIPVARLDIILV